MCNNVQALLRGRISCAHEGLPRDTGCDQWFEAVFGPSPQADDEPKGATLARAIEFMAPGDGPVVMVGDRSHDVAGALKNNAVPIGVLWGFGSREELAGAGATLIAETPDDLAHIIGPLLVPTEG